MTDPPRLLRIETTICEATFHAIVDGDVVVFATFGALPDEFAELAVTSTHPVAAALARYAAGEVAALDGIAVRQAGGPFRVRIWDALRGIAPGKPISYTALATLAGNPNAVRAAASGCATNQIPLIVPCHRVVRSDGTLGGYAFGLDLKARLLVHERVPVEDSTP